MEGLVYVATIDGVDFKIGYTTGDERQRKWAIQTMTPNGVVIMVMVKHCRYPDVVEKQLHIKFWHLKCNPHRKTGEWFKLSKNDLITLEKENFQNETKNYRCTLGGPSPFDAGSLLWRQQNTIAGQGKDVSVERGAFDASRHQYLFLADR